VLFLVVSSLSGQLLDLLLILKIISAHQGKLNINYDSLMIHISVNDVSSPIEEPHVNPRPPPPPTPAEIEQIASPPPPYKSPDLFDLPPNYDDL